MVLQYFTIIETRICSKEFGLLLKPRTMLIQSINKKYKNYFWNKKIKANNI